MSQDNKNEKLIIISDGKTRVFNGDKDSVKVVIPKPAAQRVSVFHTHPHKPKPSTSDVLANSRLNVGFMPCSTRLDFNIK